MSETDFTSRILIVDEDAGIRTVLKDFLQRYGFEPLTAANAKEMDRILASTSVDLVVLDLMVPGEDGLSICRRLCSNDGPAVIILTAVAGETDRIVGLELGADHYIAKPCSPRELIAHIRAVLRARARSASSSARESKLAFLAWRVDLATREIFNPEGAQVMLTDGEFAVLRTFLERPRRVLSRDQLIEASRGVDSDSFDRAIDVQVSRIRRKLTGLPPETIRTIRNEGYMFALEVRRL